MNIVLYSEKTQYYFESPITVLYIVETVGSQISGDGYLDVFNNTVFKKY